METRPPPLDENLIVTRERLRLLALGYKISGVIGIVLASFLIFHFLMLSIFSMMPASAWNTPGPRIHQEDTGGTVLTPAPKAANSDFVPVLMFRVFAAAIGFAICCGWTLGGLTFYAGHCIALRKHRTFIQVMAAINCIWIPYGTVLGVATFIVLGTREAEAEFPAMSPPLL